MAHTNVTDQDLADLIARTADGTAAYMRGEIRHARTLVPHADDFTLMAPYGGEPMRGVDPSDKAVAALERFFQGGEAALDVVQTYRSGDLVVLVAIERQHGVVGGLPDQDWSLRVTLVFRRDGSEWRLLHRHADPLVHGISFEHLAALARG
jgi:ketosteroid isomerase-like protein